jgi:two-component system cell cycle response regulator
LEFSLSLDLILFFCLFALFVYVFATVTITNLHKIYFVFHFFMMLWPFIQFLIKTIDNYELQMFLLKVAFIDLSLLAVGWLVFTLFLTGQMSFLRKKMSIMIYIPALIVVIGVIVNPKGIFVTLFQDDLTRRTYGFLFLYIIAILLGYLFVSLYVIYRTLRSTTVSRIKKQVQQALKGIWVIFVFSLSDVFLNVIFAQWLPIIPGLTSLGILFSAILFVIAIHRDKLLDIVTIAHQDIIDTINHGILVLDENETIVEVNKSLRSHVALHIGDRFSMDSILSRVDHVNQIKLFLETYRKYPHENSEVEFAYEKNGQQHISIHVAPIIVNGARIGRNVTFQDMSEIRRLIEKMNVQNETLQQQNQSLNALKDELFQTNAKLEYMALTDSLSGCYNRHYLTQHLEQEVIRSMRHQIPFAIILLDIDFFKLVNDQYGHLVGDDVIRSIVATIKHTLRQADTLARYGGEEFMIYLPHTNESQASILAERVRSAIESKNITAENGTYSISITVSMGLLSINNVWGNNAENPTQYLKELFASVDEALYEAKKGGRNQIVSRLLSAVSVSNQRDAG